MSDRLIGADGSRQPEGGIGLAKGAYWVLDIDERGEIGAGAYQAARPH